MTVHPVFLQADISQKLKYVQSVVLKIVDLSISSNITKNSFEIFLILLYGKSYMKIIKFSNINIMLLTNFHKNYLEQNINDKKRVSVSHNPIVLSETKNKYNSSSDYVVYAGRLTNSKGVSELLKVWEKHNYHLKLLIIGTGDSYKHLHERFSKNKNIIFKGELSNQDTIFD